MQTIYEVIIVVRVKEDGNLDQSPQGENGEKWVNLRHFNR